MSSHPVLEDSETHVFRIEGSSDTIKHRHRPPGQEGQSVSLEATCWEPVGSVVPGHVDVEDVVVFILRYRVRTKPK